MDDPEEIGIEETKLWTQWPSGTEGSTLDAGASVTGAPTTPELAQMFSIMDYVLFFAMLVSSGLIGVYFAFCAKQKQNTPSEYLMGGKKMSIVPVSLSLVASLVSGITLLGYPAEMYTYGTQFYVFQIAVLLGSVPVATIFMPVFYKLQVTSSYEYLQRRFDRKVRLLGSILYIVHCLLYIPIVIYMPALAFSQVSGFNIHLITPMVCLVCIFYTSLGGIKAVVWTDSLQTVMMFGAMLVVIIIGTYQIGGFATVWQRNVQGHRIDFFNFSLDPTIRHTFWNVIFGYLFSWTSICSLNQGVVQRFLSMSTLKRARIMVFYFTLGIIAITTISCYAGLLIYATYHDCDRLSTKIVRAPDQLLPYFVTDVAQFVPGLPGLFIAGVFSAALSTMSTGLNAMSGVIFEDFIRPLYKRTVSDERASFSMKIICALIGILCVGMVYIVEHLGAVVQMSVGFGGVTNGPGLAIFTMGMFLPWANSTGALVGGLTGMLVMGIISFGTQAAIANGQIRNPRKPMSTSGCNFGPSGNDLSSLTTMIYDEFISGNLMNSTQSILTGDPIATTAPLPDPPLPIFRLSYTTYCLLGFAVSMIVGMVTSFLTGPTRPEDVDIELLTPLVHRFFSKRCKKGDVEALKKTAKVENDCGVDLDARDNLLNKNVQKLNSMEDYYRGDGGDYQENGYNSRAAPRPPQSTKRPTYSDVREWND